MESYSRARRFYDDVIETFGQRYPRLQEDGIGMIKVTHVFEGKVPLIDALLSKNLLSGLVLKKSSSDMQRPIVEKLRIAVQEKEIRLQRSETTYAKALPELSRVSAGRPFILGDHGGYYAHLLPKLSRRFGNQFRGATEHTLNGEIRIAANLRIPFMSTARLDLKERSDRNIARTIAVEVRKMVFDTTGKDLNSSHQNMRILMVGYGIMGMHAAQHLKREGCQAELIVTDISAKKLAYAVQDDHTVATDIRNALPSCDVIILATDVIKGRKPVLSHKDFLLLKDGVCITSMTSADDELRQDLLIADGTLKCIGTEGMATIYETPGKTRLKFLLDGRPANVALSHGGGGDPIHMVEAAGLAGAFAIAQNPSPFGSPKILSDEDSEIISSLWLQHFADVKAAPRLNV